MVPKIKKMALVLLALGVALPAINCHPPKCPDFPINDAYLLLGDLMMDYKHRIREQFKFYSQDLLNNLFCHPYTKIEFLEKDLDVTRQTASKYLDSLSDKGFLKKMKIGVNIYYINEPLFDIFSQ